MATPLSLSAVPDATPYKQYVATNGQTVYPYPFPITQDADLVVVINGVTQVVDSTYSLSGQGQSLGGNVTLNAGSKAGDIITLFRDIAIERLTQFSQNGGFSSSTFNFEFNNVYLILQQLQDAIGFCLQVPNTNSPAPTTELLAANYANKYLSFDAFGNPTPALLTSSGNITQALIGSLLYAQTTAEANAGVVPTNFFYPELEPRRYGAVGDGVADDTTAMNTWVSVVNQYSTGGVASWAAGKVYLCGPLNTITASNFTLLANGSTIRVKPNSWAISPAATSIQVNMTGSGCVLDKLTIDGNQANFSNASAWTGILLVPGANIRAVLCNIINSTLQGLHSSAAGGRWYGCHFDGNANVGMELDTASDQHFTSCTWAGNGYGLQGSYHIGGPVGTSFGAALRFRTNNCTFVACEFTQNGLDGVTTGQGSYAIKYIGCRAWGNNDGGFTLNNNTTSGGVQPGDGESPFDCEWVDCEAFNNWGSGLVSYCASYDITVNGGRYYNNGRSVGSLAFTASLWNGIYFAAGSSGINVRTKSYDDRQMCPITAVSGSGISPHVLTATNWGISSGAFIATAAQYPMVALYNAALVFQGFGSITAESSGSVTVATTTNNGVTLANIAAGWFVTQRVQQNGLFADNNCQGEAYVDGYGFINQATFGSLNGWKIASGYAANGQNLRVPQYTLDPTTELLANPTMDAGVTSWTFSQDGTTGAMTAVSSTVRSAGGMQLTSGTLGSNADASFNLTAAQTALALAGAFVEFSCWAFATNAGDAELKLFWNAGSSLVSTVRHPGGGKWVKLVVSVLLPPTGLSATVAVTPRLRCNGASVTTFWDTASLRVRADSADDRDFAPKTRGLPV